MGWMARRLGIDDAKITVLVVISSRAASTLWV